MKGYLALGFCPSQRSGGYYDSCVVEVKVEDSNLFSEWFNVAAVFPEAKKWLEEKELFYFPGGKNPAFEWSEEQWQLFQTRQEAEAKASKWEDNDVTDEMFAAFSLGVV